MECISPPIAPYPFTITCTKPEQGVEEFFNLDHAILGFFTDYFEIHIVVHFVLCIRRMAIYFGLSKVLPFGKFRGNLFGPLVGTPPPIYTPTPRAFDVWVLAFDDNGHVKD